MVVDEPLLTPEVRLTSDIVYVRWHGRGGKMWYNYRYSRRELSEWIPKLREMSQSADLYGYFNNHYHGYAHENCLDVLEMLGEAIQFISTWKSTSYSTTALTGNEQ